MLRLIKLLLIVLLALPFTSYALATTTFIEGKDYKRIPQRHFLKQETGKNIQVIEFFSYGCPWCFRLEPALEKWLDKKPNNITFKRVPVTFNKDWERYAKAYYTAVALGVDKKVTPALFDAVQNKKTPLDTHEAMAAFFEAQGVKRDDFDNVFNSSPTIDAHLSQDKQLMRDNHIMAVPTIVVSGTYKTDTSMAGGDGERLMEIVSFLIKKND